MRGGEQRCRNGSETMAEDVNFCDVVPASDPIRNRKDILAHLAEMDAIPTLAFAIAGASPVHGINGETQPGEKGLGLYKPSRMALQAVQHHQRSPPAFHACDAHG